VKGHRIIIVDPRERPPTLDRSSTNASPAGQGALLRSPVAVARLVGFLGVALAVFVLDQVTKWLIVQWLREPGASVSVLWPVFSLTYVTNTGAAFGLFANQNLLFIFIAVAVIAVILFFYRYLLADHLLLRISLALQLGGALGNLLDRLRLGYVVDFLDFRVWPVFNIADSAITIGVLLLIYTLVFQPDRQTEPSAPPQPAEQQSRVTREPERG